MVLLLRAHRCRHPRPAPPHFISTKNFISAHFISTVNVISTHFISTLKPTCFMITTNRRSSYEYDHYVWWYGQDEDGGGPGSAPAAIPVLPIMAASFRI